ncbi:MAG: GspE/PulE family protein, partial [Nevskiales bacterium]
GAIARLRDMGVEPFLLSSSILGLMAQRLVRTLCKHCREAYEPDESEKNLLRLPPDESATLYHAKGCDECNHSGYRGRSGIYEFITVDDAMRTLIHDGASEQALEAHARKSSRSITGDGRLKVLKGITTLEEMLRVTRED